MFAVNNYRADGGGAFPHVASAEEPWSESTEIRTRIAEWVTAKGVLDPKDFASVDRKLTRNGTPVFWARGSRRADDGGAVGGDPW